MENSKIYDMVIVGGGLVGVSLAICLRTTALRIALVESIAWSQDHHSPSYDDKIIALSYSSQRILSGMGIWEQIVPHTIPIQQIHVSDQGHFGFTRLNRQLLGLPALGYVISARKLGEILQPLLASVPTIDIFAPARFVQLQQQETTVTTQIVLNQTLHNLTASLVIAADGGHSALCQQAAMVTEQRDYGQTALIANVTLAQSHQYTAYERFTPAGPLALLPLKDHDCALIWTVQQADVNRMMALTDSEFLTQLQREFGWRLGQFLRVGTRQVYPLRLIRTRPNPQSRVIAIGNAAHTLHPIAGQGLNLGLRDMAHLAEFLIDTNQLGIDIGSPDRLDCYLKKQQPDAERIINITDGLVQTFSNNRFPLTLMRNLGLLSVDILPPLKKYFIRQMTGLNGHPSRLLRGLPLV
jgi:2-octaprenyl-6-methoxyphenol hydroxylase